MKVNLATKITLSRIVLSVILIILMIVSLEKEIPQYVIGLIFIIAAVTDKLDGYIARSRNQVTDFGKISDAIADKILVTPILFLMAATGIMFKSSILSFLIPIIILVRDMVVDIVKTAASSKGPVVAASNLGKIKTAVMMTGMSIVVLGLPNYFGEIGKILKSMGLIAILIATLLSVISGIEYVQKNKKSLI